MSATTKPSGLDRAAPGHEWCLFCGEKNLYSLGLNFTQTPDGSVHARFRPHSGLQGYAGILHGGAVAGILDAAMTHCLFQAGVRALTADLHVRYLRPAPCYADMDVQARVTEAKPPLYRLRADLHGPDGPIAWAEAKFLRAVPDPGEAQSESQVNPGPPINSRS